MNDCALYRIMDVYSLIVIIPYVIYWTRKISSRFLLWLLVALNFLSLLVQFASLPLFAIKSQLGDCYIFQSEKYRYIIFFIMLAILVALPMASIQKQRIVSSFPSLQAPCQQTHQTKSTLFDYFPSLLRVPANKLALDKINTFF